MTYRTPRDEFAGRVFDLWNRAEPSDLYRYLFKGTLTNPYDSSPTGEPPGATDAITQLTGDVTAMGPGPAVATISANAVTTAKILDAAVTLAKMQHIATASLLGRASAGTGDVEVLTDIPASITLGGKYIYRADGTDVPVADGGTGKSAWTLYAIPYASGVTTLGEIAIGAAGKVLAVAAGATGYEWVDNTAGVTDHGALTGLADDDHTQYAKAGASRVGTISVEANSAINQDLSSDSAVAQFAKLGLGQAPAFPLDIVAAVSTKAQIHVGDADDSDGFLLGFADTLYASGGIRYSGSGGNWTAKAATAGLVHVGPSGRIDFYTFSGLTAGNNYALSSYLRLTIGAAGDIGVAATKKVYLDGVALTGDTYILETSANVMDFFAGAAKTLSLSATAATITGNLLFDGASTRNIGSTTAEVANIYIGTGRAYFGATQASSIYDDGTYLRIVRA